AEYYRPERSAQSDAAGEDHETGPNGFDLHALSGNLCRCTGYRPIRDAAYALGAPDQNDPLQKRLENPAPQHVETVTRSQNSEFHRPGTYAELLSRFSEQPDAVLMAGATD